MTAMHPTKTPDSLKRLRRFEEAVRELAFIGTQHPADHRAIQEEYEAAKMRVKEVMK